MALLLGVATAIAQPGDDGALGDGALDSHARALGDIRTDPLPERYALVGTWENTLPVRGVYHPEGIDATDNGIIFVAERGNHRISSWLINGDANGQWGTRGAGPGELESPEDVAVDKDRDRLYVADTGNRRVQVLNRRTGAHQATWDDVGLPRGVAVSADGQAVYVSDAQGHRILVFDPDGQRQAAWGGPGRAAGQIDTPLGMSVAADGRLYVADSGNQRVLWFEGDGTPAGALVLDSHEAPGGIPHDVDVDDNGDLYVAVARGLLRFRADGAYAGTTWPLLDATPEPVPNTNNHEGVRRVAVAPGAGIQLTYAPALTFGDQISLFPERWFPIVTGGALSQRHTYDPHRIDADGTQAHVLDTSGLLRIYTRDGAWRNERQAFPGGPGIDIAGMPDETAVLAGNRVTITGLRCPNFTCPQRAFDALDPNMMTRYNKVNERVPDDRWWNTALVSSFQGFALVDTGKGRMVVRTSGGDLVGAETLVSRSDPYFRAFRDVETMFDGSLWFLARDGEIKRFDRRGRDLESVWLQGLEHRAAESLAINEASGEPELFVLTADQWVFKLTLGGEPLAAWSLVEAAGPGRYADITTDALGRVLVPDGAGDRTLIFDWAEGPAPEPVPDPRGPRCRVTPDKTASPSRLPLGDTTDVTLTLDGDCGRAHETLDVVLVLDRTCRVFLGDRARYLKEGAIQFVEALDTNRDRVALVAYPDEIGTARLWVPFTSDKSELTEALREWNSICFEGGGEMPDGLRVAREALVGPHARRDAGKAVVLVSQGYKRERGMWEARRLWRMGAQLHTIAGGPDQYDAGGFADDGLLASMADLPHRYRHAEQPIEMLAVWEDVTAEITDRVLFRDLEIIDRIPGNMRLVQSSVQPPADRLPDGALRWAFKDVGFEGPPDLTYTLRPLEAGRWPTNIEATAFYTDGLDYPGSAIYPVPMVDVIPPESPTPRPSDTPEPTPTAPPSATPTFTPTATPTRTPTATRTPGPTPVPAPIFLPIVYKQQCKPSVVPLDVALVIDTSSSMGGGKLDAAIAAARGFVALLSLPRDHAAVIAFDAEARRVQTLTGDRNALDLALAGLTNGVGTRIDLGLWEALDEVGGERARAEADGIIVLLTDGRPQGGTEREIALAAQVARELGVTTYAIGLGADVQPAVLALIAGDPSRVFLAPTTDDLAAIYDEIARIIPCR